MRKHLIFPTAVLFSFITFTGCKVDPAPPSVEDAKQVWTNINKRSGFEQKAELVDLKKTDGQIAEVNGVKIYTLFYDAHVRHLTPLGNWKSGDIETISSNYGFQKTENGWQGPDGTHFSH